MNANIFAATGAGINRRPYRIREFLRSKGLNMKDVADALALSHSVVSETVRGVKNNRKVLGYLRDLGCPKGDLSLPEDMKNEEAA